MKPLAINSPITPPQQNSNSNHNRYTILANLGDNNPKKKSNRFDPMKSPVEMVIYQTASECKNPKKPNFPLLTSIKPTQIPLTTTTKPKSSIELALAIPPNGEPKLHPRQPPIRPHDARRIREGVVLPDGFQSAGISRGVSRGVKYARRRQRTIRRQSTQEGSSGHSNGL